NSLLSGTLFGTLVLAAIVFCLLFLLFRGDSRYARMPPGPTPVPLIGNLLQLNQWAFHESFMKLKETYGPVMTVYLGPKPLVVLVGFDAVHEALVEQADEQTVSIIFYSYEFLLLSSHFFVGLGQSNGERWKQLRRFSLSTLRDFGMGRRNVEEWIQEEVKHLTEEFRKTEGAPFDPTITLSRAVSNVICSIVFGQRFDYQDKNFVDLLSLLEAHLRLLSKPIGMVRMFEFSNSLTKLIPGPFNKMLMNVNELTTFTSAMIDKHKATLVSDSPRDYIDSFLIKMKQESNNPDTEFNYDNLNMTILDLFIAGTETTSTTLRYGWLILMKYPHIQENVQKEIDTVIGRERAPAMEDRRKMPYTDAVLHEIQRFIDLQPLNVFHKTTRDTIFRGYTIPEVRMHFYVSCAKFRICAGEGLAKMELFLFFTTLLQNFSFCPTEDPDSISLSPDSKLVFKTLRPYKFKAIPR
uniref:Uncharacterized protein n=1 Tax=Erpetoichthys calabaricus TaxID=27687 RepID=A0A8C4RBG9_ERPCA